MSAPFIGMRREGDHVVMENGGVLRTDITMHDPTMAAEPSTSIGVRRPRMVHASVIVGGVVLVTYGLWLLLAVLNGRDSRDFIYIGRGFVGRSHASPAIQIDPTYSYPAGTFGYDGQFCYYIALDPVNARYYIDNPSYRYTRIVYPLLARVLALGNPSLIPFALIVINWLALAGGTWTIAAWLRRKGISPWIALVFGFFPGLFFALGHDLTEPLAYAGVALAIYLFDFGGRHRLIWSAVTFALAILTRELAAVFAVVYGLSLLEPSRVLVGIWRERRLTGDQWKGVVKRSWRALSFLVIALLPFGAYKVFLRVWLGSVGVPAAHLPDLVPLRGIFFWWPWSAEGGMEEARSLVIPGLICLGVTLWAIAKRSWSTEILNLFACTMLYVILLAAPAYIDYQASGRLSAPVVLAAIATLPTTDRLFAGNRSWFWASSALWLSLVPFMFFLPTITGYLLFLRP
jgi:hypothetical protein